DRGPRACRGGHDALPPSDTSSGTAAYFRGLIDLPFDPNLHIGSLSFAWHSIFSLVGMIVGSFVSFRAARYLIQDDRIYPFAIAVVIGGLLGARVAHVLDNWNVYAPRPLGQTDYVHPVAAYDGLVMVLIFIVLVAYWRRVRGRPPESRVYWAYLLLFGGFRFLTSFLRLDPLFVDGLQEAQILGLIYAVAGGIMLPVLSARSRLDSVA